MNSYLLIETRDHFESLRVNHSYQLAVDLKEKKNEVKLFILQNAVFSFRNNINIYDPIENIIKKDIPIFIDEFSIKERGIDRNNLRKEIVISSMDVILDHLVNKTKVIWHS
ncbi:DsrE family protein [Pigmentibacter sp. JX0631]|uniref:DsrE family protein n=1 Tax=Pigmentibacter sp. JX0631 TaxID=2976982 RepID=UPI0024697294|nr:DsrE family protein [Pigmentibacter sp. JX0631]WGL60012.1 DsrE family protein [Pigmentibacter sp. JX0631]